MATKNFAWQNFFETTLSSNISDSDTTIPLNTAPSGNEGVLIIEPDSATNREVIYYTSKSGSSVVLPSAVAGRGQDNTTAQSHTSGVTVAMNTSASMFKGLQDGTAMSDDSILARHLDWASTGADGGIWWEELGRTTLGGTADTISVTSIPARTFLRVIAYASGTNIRGAFQFNGDTGANYANRTSDNNGADSTATGSTSLFAGDSGGNNVRIFTVLDIINFASLEKQVIGNSNMKTTAGSGSAPSRRETSATWANTTDQITRVDFNQTSSGDFASGSVLIVLGHN